MTVSNSPRVAKSVTFSFVLFRPNKYFFNLHSLTLLLPFLSNSLGDTKTIKPFALKGHGSLAHSASPHSQRPELFRCPVMQPTLSFQLCAYLASCLSPQFAFYISNQASLDKDE